MRGRKNDATRGQIFIFGQQWALGQWNSYGLADGFPIGSDQWIIEVWGRAVDRWTAASRAILVSGAVVHCVQTINTFVASMGRENVFDFLAESWSMGNCWFAFFSIGHQQMGAEIGWRVAPIDNHWNGEQYSCWRQLQPTSIRWLWGRRRTWIYSRLLTWILATSVIQWTENCSWLARHE